jgi:hypothetical protein
MAFRKLRSNFKKREKSLTSTPPDLPAQTWRDRLSLTAWIGLLLFGIVALFVFSAKAQWAKSIEDRLSALQSAYQLPDATISRFREIELEFHGSGNPFTSAIPHTQIEVRIHHEQIAALMEPEMGKKFLLDMHRGRWRH